MKTLIKQISLVVIIAASFTFCTPEKKQDPFEVGKHYIGLLTDSTQVMDLDLVFPNDSIVEFSVKGDEFTGQNNDIDIYSKQGDRLLSLSPREILDSTSTIESVQILSGKYKTKKNVSVLSTFKDINDNYKISKIDNLINTIVVSVNELNASFSIDKKELPANLRYDMNLNIEAVQIPDNAKIKYFILHW